MSADKTSTYAEIRLREMAGRSGWSHGYTEFDSDMEEGGGYQ